MARRLFRGRKTTRSLRKVIFGTDSRGKFMKSAAFEEADIVGNQWYFHPLEDVRSPKLN